MAADNGWDELKRVIVYRLDKHEVKLDEMSDLLNELVVNQARMDERLNRRAAVTGALTGFLAGLSGWLKP